jgi:hypothetical protein
MVISRLLKFALFADAAATAATGLLMAVFAASLGGLLGLPAPLLQSAGWVLLAYAAVVGYLGSRIRVPAAAIWTVIVLNVLWAVDSAALLFTGWVAPTGLGMAFIIFQTVMVAGLAEWQYFGLRQSQRHTTPVGSSWEAVRPSESAR